MSMEGKIWGRTAELFCRNNVELHRLEIAKGGYCSKHRHVGKHNLFFVESGRLIIRVWRTDFDETILEPGGVTQVGPQLLHQFEAMEDTVAFEVCWTVLDPDDIIRESEGGMSGCASPTSA